MSNFSFTPGLANNRRAFGVQGMVHFIVTVPPLRCLKTPVGPSLGAAPVGIVNIFGVSLASLITLFLISTLY